MKCEELLALLNDYVDSTADPVMREEFEEHLEGCRPCRIVVDNIRKTITVYRHGQPCNLPAEFRRRLYTGLRQRWKEMHTEQTD
jgi:hypothetical protein